MVGDHNYNLEDFGIFLSPEIKGIIGIILILCLLLSAELALGNPIITWIKRIHGKEKIITTEDLAWRLPCISIAIMIDGILSIMIAESIDMNETPYSPIILMIMGIIYIIISLILTTIELFYLFKMNKGNENNA
jgi:hypothetical protein